MSIDISRNERLRSERTLICHAAAGVHCEGQALALQVPRRVFFGALRGTGPRTTGGSPAPVGQDRLILPDGNQAIAIYRGQTSLSL